MNWVLRLIAGLSFLGSLGTCTMAKGAIHEIEALVLFLIGVVAIGCGAIIESIEALSDNITEQFKHLAEFLKERSKGP